MIQSLLLRKNYQFQPRDPSIFETAVSYRTALSNLFLLKQCVSLHREFLCRIHRNIKAVLPVATLDLQHMSYRLK